MLKSLLLAVALSAKPVPAKHKTANRHERRVSLTELNEAAMYQMRVTGSTDAKLLHVLLNPNADAAMVVYRLDGRVWGMFFVIRHGQWAMDGTQFLAY